MKDSSARASKQDADIEEVISIVFVKTETQFMLEDVIEVLIFLVLPPFDKVFVKSVELGSLRKQGSLLRIMNLRKVKTELRRTRKLIFEIQLFLISTSKLRTAKEEWR